ncbi:hypothetical protein N7475_008653 [Penicillium sp. IBT 31633x]|nr:hypothetical protein N7475_008653 [Penicillium sp. IBT 31633x]
MEATRKYDIIIVGAGIAGINAAYRVQTTLPNSTYAILEARDTPGGTWDLFRYPGVRLDSDIHTYGFSWHPYHHDKTMLDGSSIFNYINGTAAQYGIKDHILLNYRVKQMNWSSKEGQWSLDVVKQTEELRFGAQFVIFATGYFDHQRPLPTEINGLNNFEGAVIQPQFWPCDLDYIGKRIAVIGSGATAVSLVPRLAETAAAVTIIQRNPNYILSIPSGNGSWWLSRLLPATLSHKLKRYGWLAVTLGGYYICRKFPLAAKSFFLKLVSKQLPAHIPLSPHFEPKHNVWDQRLLACPDGDLFQSMQTKKVTVETATIENFASDAIVLDSGKVIQADIIVTATGLRLQIGGGIQVEIDGIMYDISKKFMWKGMMLQNLPNAFFALGYLTNASWTLGVDATALFICRLIKHMHRNNVTKATPQLQDPAGRPCKLWNLGSSYVLAAEGDLPQAGEVAPWQARSNYILDLLDAQYGPLGTCMEFS